MTKPCSICISGQRDIIDKRLLNGDSLRELERIYHISKSALSRHRAEHLNLALVKASPLSPVVAHNKGVREQLTELHNRTWNMLDHAEADGDGRLAVVVMHELRSNLELIFKIDTLLADRDAQTRPAPGRTIYVNEVRRDDGENKKALSELIDRMVLNAKLEILCYDHEPSVDFDGSSKMGKIAWAAAIKDLRDMCKAAGITVETIKNDNNKEGSYHGRAEELSHNKQ